MGPRIPPPAFMLIAAALMWALNRWVPYGHWIPAPWNRLGVVPGIFGIAIALSAVLRFRKFGTTPNPVDLTRSTRLVTDGIYGITRNPMYLGLTLLLVGWAWWLGSPTPWLIPILFVLLMTFIQIIPEELTLQRLFPDEYAAYRRRVARWVGKP